MSKKRLKLSDLEVKSFVTNFNNENEQTLKGGTGQTIVTGFVGCLCFPESGAERCFPTLDNCEFTVIPC